VAHSCSEMIGKGEEEMAGDRRSRGPDLFLLAKRDDKMDRTLDGEEDEDEGVSVDSF